MADNPPRILHLIERLTLGGAGRSLIAAARQSTASNRILSLLPSDGRAAQLAHTAEIAIVEPQDLVAEVTKSDVVHLHFWNTPTLYAALRTGLPPCRLAITSHVVGDTPPHVLTPELTALADGLIVTSPDTVARCAQPVERVEYIPSAADLTRVAQVRPRSGMGFTIGYVGTLDFAKLHPDFLALHAGLNIPNLRLIIAGAGPAEPALRRQAIELGFADRVAFAGYVEDISVIFSNIDVFGYPLRPESYATSETVVQEAMAAGLPCVLLARSGGAQLITHGETGMLAHDAADYAGVLRSLHADPERRQRIGANAVAHAREHFGADRAAAKLDAFYRSMLAAPRSGRALPPVASGCDAFLAGLGAHATLFVASLAGDPAADAAVAASDPALASANAGGILHYRRAFPTDPALRFWSGLVLLTDRRPALAAAEFKAAGELGFDGKRCAEWLDGAIAASSGYRQASSFSR